MNPGAGRKTKPFVRGMEGRVGIVGLGDRPMPAEFVKPRVKGAAGTNTPRPAMLPGPATPRCAWACEAVKARMVAAESSSISDRRDICAPFFRVALLLTRQSGESI